MKKELGIIIAALIAVTCFAQKADVRSWTRQNGSVVCEGTFVKVYIDPKSGAECAKFKKSEGGETSALLKMLSDADKEYIKKISAEPAAE